MWQRIRKFSSDHQLTPVLIGGIISVLVSFSGAWLSYHYATVSQVQQAKITRIGELDAGANEFTSVGGKFIFAINSSKDGDLGKIRAEFNILLAKQLRETEELKPLFGDEAAEAILNYQKALMEFNSTMRDTSTPEQMGAWAERFGRVLDLKNALTTALYSAAGIKASQEIRGAA